jgi:hypothetical protein
VWLSNQKKTGSYAASLEGFCGGEAVLVICVDQVFALATMLAKGK